MRQIGRFFSALVLFASVIGGVLGLEEEEAQHLGKDKRSIDATVSCKQIAKAISSASDVYWPGGSLPFSMIHSLLLLAYSRMVYSLSPLHERCQSLGKVQL